jgi:hypothetical protein
LRTVATFTKATGHFAVAGPLGALQHDPAAKGEGLLALGPSCPSFERLALVVAQHHLDPVQVPVVPSLPPIVADNGRNAPTAAETP